MVLPALAQDGPALFRARCAGCHGADGTGAGRGSNIVTSRQRSATKEAVHDLIRAGLPGMPAFDLPEAQLDAIAAYVMSLRGADAAKPAATAVPVPFADVTRPKPGSWPTYHGSLSGNRYSSLDQINTRNVERLAPKWLFMIPGASSLQMTPVVVNNVMYITAVNEAYALDASTGREKWHYKRPRTTGLAGDAASGINRGVAVLDSRVFMVTDNAHVIALDSATGKLLWDVEMADSKQNYGATSAPLVVNNLVISGVSGGDEGVRGFLDAYRAETGERAWRFWTVRAPGEPGSETWAGRAAEHGCAATWLTGTYDPEAKLLYWPTGNPCPDYNGDERKGDNLYSSSVIALDPDTGKLKWHFQFTPHDLHDWDATETPMLVDAVFQGKSRKLLLQGNRNGFSTCSIALPESSFSPSPSSTMSLGQAASARMAARSCFRATSPLRKASASAQRWRARPTGHRRLTARRRACFIFSPSSPAISTRRMANGGRQGSPSTAATPPPFRARPRRANPQCSPAPIRPTPASR